MIFLIGFMGAGKTTAGEKLAKVLNWTVVDTDRQIEEKYQMTITEIFEKSGENRFREMETQILAELEGDRSIVMTGGGMAIKEVNRRMMQKKGKIVWLNCSIEEIKKRLEKDTARPLIVEKGLEGIMELYTERLPLYEEAADCIIETSGLTVDETVDEILSCLKIDRHGETN